MKNKALNAKTILQGLQKKDRSILSRAITLVESHNKTHQKTAKQVLAKVSSSLKKPKSFRLGVSGVPGVGKSTFIDTLGSFLCDQGYSVAVLTIDPSSEIKGGSILGDQTRMGELFKKESSYLRTTPSSGVLGGVAKNTFEAMLLCEYFGFDFIFIETVGVGQSEIEVAHLVDRFLFLQAPGTGDELQGIKKGVLEMLDLMIVHKADGALLQKAKEAKSQNEMGLHLLRSGEESVPNVLLVSSLEKTGMKDVWEEIKKFQTNTPPGEMSKKRKNQEVRWFKKALIEKMKEKIFSSKKVIDLEKKIKSGRVKAYEALAKFT